MAYLCEVCGAIFKDGGSFNQHVDEGHRHDDEAHGQGHEGHRHHNNEGHRQDDEGHSDFYAGVGAPMEGVGFEESEETVQIPPTPEIEMAYGCAVCGAILKDPDLFKYHGVEGHRHDYDDDAGNLLRGIFSSPAFAADAAVAVQPTTQRGHRGHPLKVPAGSSQKKHWKSCTLSLPKIAYNSALLRHEVVHATDDKPFACPSCSKPYKYKESLKKHMKSRGGATCQMLIKKYTCDVCQAQFGTKEVLKSHQFVHAAERPFQCHLCAAGFTQNGGLQSHLRTHTGERPFECHLCDASFSQNGSLKAHQLVHSPGQKPFKCPICFDAFRTKPTLSQHSKKFHPGNQNSPKNYPTSSDSVRQRGVRRTEFYSTGPEISAEKI